MRKLEFDDPIFGYDKKGGSSTRNNTYLKGSKFLCPDNGVAESITVYIMQYSSETPKIKCAIYKDNNGYPGELVAVTEEWILTSGWDDWKSFNITSGGQLTTNTYYWLIVWSNRNYWLYYSSGETNQSVYKLKAYTGDFPDPFPSGGTYQNYVYSIYCTYTAGVPPVGKLSRKHITLRLG